MGDDVLPEWVNFSWEEFSWGDKEKTSIALPSKLYLFLKLVALFKRMDIQDLIAYVLLQHFKAPVPMKGKKGRLVRDTST